MAPRRSARVATQSNNNNAAAATVSAPSTPKKRSKATAAAVATTPKSPPTKKTRLTGLKNPPPTFATSQTQQGVVDPASGVTGTIVCHDGEPCDVRLVLVDPAKNSDKYYVLQWIQTKDNKQVVYARWGRTGTAGQGMLRTLDTHALAQAEFESKFQQKSGLAWSDRALPTPAGKYRVVQQDFEAKQAGYLGTATWQYWVDDGVDGKVTGWYDYDKPGSAQAEQLYSEHVRNANLYTRCVESGVWIYQVDLANMTQTNVKHPARKCRHIRRVPIGTPVDNAPPAALATATASTPSRKAPAIVTPQSSPAPKAAPKTHSHPVDPDVALHGQSAASWTVVHDNDSDYWYDAVLNQCNITGSSNNNKYYRLQVLRDQGNTNFACWQKWGRVGEPARRSSSAFKIFKDQAAAVKEYAKKFKDKSGNVHSADSFVPIKGKYTLIEIDNDVQVTQDAVGQPDKSETADYLPTALDPLTAELIEVLFSKDMRDQALTSFHLDLKRLPLGVPSKAQIEHGVTVLNKIDQKLNGQDVSDSFDELSSQFYTAIPHSFGRTRPPTINSADALQSRYDMCDILLDMFSTNETVRKIEKEQAKKKQRPHPVDSHYESLQADLSLLDKATDEFRRIQTYFDKTKAGRSQLINVWTVDRHGEAHRFRKFDKLDNRRLLWHGTNIAVVAPILTSGLRIMPHSGGRVGAGIYLASMQEKSASYTSGYGAKFACMFLTEAALGKMHPVTQDGSHASSLKKAPPGYDSVHAVGRISPKKWTTCEIDGKTVQVPQAEAGDMGTDSSFHHDEFLAYDEAQVRIRYVLTVRL